MERPRTPTIQMASEYQGSPIIGTPGRQVIKVEGTAKEAKVVKMTDVNLGTPKAAGGKFSVKGRVEKTASLGIAPMGGKNVPFFAINICDDVCYNYICLRFTF